MHKAIGTHSQPAASPLTAAAKGRGVARGGAIPERQNEIKIYTKNRKIKKKLALLPKNSEPNPKNFRFLVRDTLGPSQVGPLLDEILATCLAQDSQHRYTVTNVQQVRKNEGFGGCEIEIGGNEERERYAIRYDLFVCFMDCSPFGLLRPLHGYGMELQGF